MTAFPPAVRRLGYAALEARAARTRQVMARVEPRRTRVRLWLPLTPLFLILAPVPLLLAPLGYLIPGRWRPDPFLAVLGLGALLLSLSGADIEVRARDADVHVTIL